MSNNKKQFKDRKFNNKQKPTFRDQHEEKDQTPKQATAMGSKLMEMASHISTFHIAGKQIKGDTFAGEINQALHLGNRIVCYDTYLTPGYCVDPTSPFNKSMIEFFNSVRGKYTSSVPFQANDLGTYVLAWGQVIALIGAIRRMFDSLKVTSYENNMTPWVLHYATLMARPGSPVSLADMKRTYDKDVLNAPSYEFALARAIDRLSGFVIPECKYIRNCQMAYRNMYFEDATQFRGDIEMMINTRIMRWAPDVTVVGGGAVASGIRYEQFGAVPEEGIKVWIDVLNQCIDSMVQDDSIRTISGWLKQYIASSMDLKGLAEESDGVIADGKAVANLIIGLRCTNSAPDDICQDPNTESLIAKIPAVTTVQSHTVTNWVLNFDHECTDAEIAEATTLTATPIKDVDGTVYYDTSFMACHDAAFYIGGEDSEDFNVLVNFQSSSSALEPIKRILWAHDMDTRPTFVFTLATVSGLTGVTFDSNLAYQFPVSGTSLRNMHYAALVDAFKVIA